MIQLEADLVKAQEVAGLPIQLPPDIHSESANFAHLSSSMMTDTQKVRGSICTSKAV